MGHASTKTAAPVAENRKDTLTTAPKSTTSVPAQTTKYATPVSPGEYVILRADTNTQVLDVSGGSKKNGANIQLYTSNNTDAQLWRVNYDKDGLYTFVNTQSNKALDVKYAKAKNGTNVWQYTQNGTDAQKWVLVVTETGIRIESAINRNYVLDCMNGKTKDRTNIQIWKNNGTAAQRFEFINTKPTLQSDTIENGVYVIKSAIDTNKVIDVAGGSADVKGNVQIYSDNQSTAQRWNIVRGSDGYYTITSVESGFVLDVQYALKTPATNVWQYTSNGTNAQKWALQANTDGSYSFISKNSAMALSVQSSKVLNGTNVQTARPSNSKTQNFILKRVPILADGTYSFYSKLAHTTQAMDIEGGLAAQNTKVQTYTFDDAVAQRYMVKNIGNDTYTIQALASGRYITDASGAVVQQSSKQGVATTAQQWKISVRGNGIVFMNVATGKVIAVPGTKVANGTKLQTKVYSGKSAEKFRPVKHDSMLAPGLYIIESRTSAAVMDVKDGSWNNSINVQTWAKNNSNAQKWAFISENSGYYHILMPLSGNALEVASADATGRANVRMNSSVNNDAAQLWRMDFSEVGYVFTNKATGTVLGIAAEKAQSGTNVLVSAATGQPAQAWNLRKTNVNLTDTTSLKNLIKNAANGSKPRLDANGRKYKVSDGAYKQLMNALSQAWNRGKYVDFIMLETSTGITYALHADRKTYGASTSKAALVTYIYQQLLEKEKVSNSTVYNLMYQTIVHSNNSTYATLYSQYAGSGYKKWLDTMGVGWVANSMYTTTTPRSLELVWGKNLAYEESGGKYVGQWRKMFNKSDYSFIQQSIGKSNTVYSKPGWMFGGSYGTIHDDAAIVKDRSGSTYVLAVMTNLHPDSQRWISKDVVKALSRIHQEMPKA